MYFVRDGHHRISVAQAMGQTNIDAEVTEWRVFEPSPEEKPVAVHGARTLQRRLTPSLKST
jgi:hypothetical protein